MKWIETIDLRASSFNSETVISEILSVLNEISDETIKDSVKLYSHIGIRTDFSIHISHENEEIEIAGTKLGHFIADDLKRFGLVNHYVWVEVGLTP